MKKLMYLLVAGTMFVFTACNCGADDAAVTEETAVEEVVADDAAVERVAIACADDCPKACCLGCKATEGEVACLADHSCCAVKETPHDESVPHTH